MGGKEYVRRRGGVHGILSELLFSKGSGLVGSYNEFFGDRGSANTRSEPHQTRDLTASVSFLATTFDLPYCVRGLPVRVCLVRFAFVLFHA